MAGIRYCAGHHAQKLRMLTRYGDHRNRLPTTHDRMECTVKRNRSSSTQANPAVPGAFAALASLRGTLPAGAEPAPPEPRDPLPLGGRIIVTRERKGRGGKTVTLVRGIALTGPALDTLAREMRQALGTGGSVEGDAIVLGGDQSMRVAEWLRARGATRIVTGN